jgi:hypothetical protein
MAKCKNSPTVCALEGEREEAKREKKFTTHWVKGVSVTLVSGVGRFLKLLGENFSLPCLQFLPFKPS